jgi:hypothetical protein
VTYIFCSSRLLHVPKICSTWNGNITHLCIFSISTTSVYLH